MIVPPFVVLPWSAQSPNLSPVEHVLDKLGRQHLPGADLPDLQGQLQQLWADLLRRRKQQLYDCFALNHCLYPSLRGCHTLLTQHQECVHAANSTI
uniref:Uncharacterized protein n=1 Tax=Kryptolebias marmoratus TaxID=37003 RepID=A0A3Q3BBN2_KRYMA